MNKFGNLKLVLKTIKVNTTKHVTPLSQGYNTCDLNRICVYEHYYNNENKPFYVGQGTIRRAFTLTTSRNVGWRNKVKDVSLVKVRIVSIDITIDESIKLETKLIAKYKRIEEGGTLVNGNDGGLSIGNKGKDNYFYNKHFYGNNNSNYGNKYNLNPLSIPIIQIDILGNIVKEWSSNTEASEILNICPNSILGCCKGKRHIAGGYQWIYKKDYNENKDYTYIPGKTNNRITICIDIYGNYIKTYYSNKELLTDGFKPSNVSQVCNGSKKTHKGYIFRNFFTMTKENKDKLINENLVDVTRYCDTNN